MGLIENAHFLHATKQTKLQKQQLEQLKMQTIVAAHKPVAAPDQSIDLQVLEALQQSNQMQWEIMTSLSKIVALLEAQQPASDA